MRRLEPDSLLRTLRLGFNTAGALLTLGVALIGGWLLWGPLSQDSADASRRTETLDALLRDEGRLRAEHMNLKKQLETARQQQAALERRIPDEPHEADFLAQVSRSAGEVGLQITDYRPGVISSGKSCSTMRVELSCEGNYRSLCTFLDRLQGLPRHSTVVHLDVDASGPPDKYLAKIGLELYFFVGGQKSKETQVHVASG